MSIKDQYAAFAAKAKPWGGHHILPGLVLTVLVGPWVNAAVWIGKEIGEATERAGGTSQVLRARTLKTKDNPEGIWEPYDALTPAVAGHALHVLHVLAWGMF